VAAGAATQLLPQRVGIAAGQFATHVEPEQTGVLPLHTCPHVPQLFPLFVVLRQAPLQDEYPVLHAKVQALAAHAGPAFATAVVQTLPHEPQLLRSRVVSTHAVPQRAGVAAGHPETHAYIPESPPALEQVGALASHALPQPPQLAAFVKSTHDPSHTL
jgi:hypothetical protein